MIPAGSALLVSAFGADGRGGVFAFDGESLTQLDDLPSTGLACAGGRLARVLRSSGDFDSVGELLVYDDRGVRDYHRIDSLQDGHDVAFHDGRWLVVSTVRNAVLRCDGSDSEVVWQPTEVADAWHLNCLAITGHDVWVSGFGDFDDERGWSGDRAVGTGFIRNIRSGATLRGLTHPHSPRPVEDGWLVCESLEGRIVTIASDGTRSTVAAVDGYARGLAVSGHLLFVGTSSNRSDTSADASVAIVSRRDGATVGRIAVPACEVYDVVVVPSEFVRAVARGFDTNLQRVAALRARRPWRPLHRASPDLAALGQPLAGAGCRVDVRVEGPLPQRAGESSRLDVQLRNLGSLALATVAPHPVHLSYRWRGPQGQVDGPRLPLDGLLAPHATLATEMVVAAPDTPGVYELAVSLVQEGVLWFDDEDPRNGWSRSTTVVG
jgi:hypothetical protein